MCHLIFAKHITTNTRRKNEKGHGAMHNYYHQREGREKAIPAGEPCDLVDVRYTKIYRAVGREKFIEWIKEGLELKRMEKRLKEMQK